MTSRRSHEASALVKMIETMSSMLYGMSEDVRKSDRGFLEAGVRTRKVLLRVRELAQEARVYSLDRDQTRRLERRAGAELKRHARDPASG